MAADITGVERALLNALNDLKNIRQAVGQQATADGGANGGNLADWVGTAVHRVETDLRLHAEELADTVTRAKLDLDPKLVKDAQTAHMLTLLQAGQHKRMQGQGHGPDKLAQTLRAVSDKPNSEIARAFIQARYGVPAVPPPTGSNARTVGRGTPLGRVLSSKTVRPTTLLSSSQRRDPAEPLPPLRNDDIRKGMLSMVEKGLLPPTTDLTYTFNQFGGDPLLAQRLRLLEYKSRFEQPEEPVGGAVPWGYNFAAVRLDLLNMPREGLAAAGGAADGSGLSPLVPSSQGPGRSPPSLPGYDMLTIREEASALSLGLLPPQDSDSFLSGIGDDTGAGANAVTFAERQARDYNDIMDAFSLHQFVVRKGITLDSTPEFRSFQRTYAKQWPSISELIRRIEEFAAEYSLPMVVLDGKLLAQVAKDWLPLSGAAPPTVPSGRHGHRGAPGHHGELSSNWAAHLPNDVLISCMDNKPQVGELLRQPGRMFRGPLGREKAATRIQSQYRGHTVRLRLGRHAAATVIQTRWRLELMRRRTRARAYDVKRAAYARFEGLQAELRANWVGLYAGPRVLVHVPSMSAFGERALGLSALDVLQNGQLSRLTGLRDPHVDVVYVAPRPLSDDVEGYYQKLLATVGGLGDLSGRCRILVPENHSRLPAHLPLSRLLLYSPRALRRITAIIAGRPALLVPGLQGGEDEFLLAAALGIPLLAPGPATATHYGRKSGARQLFRAAQVNLPPGVAVAPMVTRAKRRRNRGTDPGAPWLAPPADQPGAEADDVEGGGAGQPPAAVGEASFSAGAAQVKSDPSAIITPGAAAAAAASRGDLLGALGALMQAHPLVPRWLMKVDDEFWGRGHAYIDTAGLKTVRALLEAYQRAEERRVLEAADAALQRIAQGAIASAVGEASAKLAAASAANPFGGVNAMTRDEVMAAVTAALRLALPRRAAFTAPSLWPTWAAFEAAFERRGGVVEACPTVVTGSPSINLLVAPDGAVTVLSTHEQMFSPAYRFIGASFPQSSVPHSALAQVGAALGAACFRAGVIGYVGVDFVALRDAGRLRLWAVDLNLRMTATQATYALFDFVCGGAFQADTGRYLVPKAPDAPAADDPFAKGAVLSLRAPGGGASHGGAGGGGGAAGSGPSIFTGTRGAPAASAAVADLAGGGPAAEVPMERRFYVMNDLVSHPNLALAQFNTFFHRCKLEGMVFDVQDRVGTTFMLRGNFSGGAVGVVCVGASPQDAFQRQAEAMDFLQRLVGPDDPSRSHEDMGTFRAVHSTVHFISSKLATAQVGAPRTR